MSEVVELFRGSDGLAGGTIRARLSARVPTLTPAGRHAPVAFAHGRAEAWVASDGYVALAEAAPIEMCTRMIAAIYGLVSEGLPAMFVYLFDEPWSLGLAIAERISR